MIKRSSSRWGQTTTTRAKCCLFSVVGRHILNIFWRHSSNSCTKFLAGVVVIVVVTVVVAEVAVVVVWVNVVRGAFVVEVGGNVVVV